MQIDGSFQTEFGQQQDLQRNNPDLVDQASSGGIDMWSHEDYWTVPNNHIPYDTIHSMPNHLYKSF